MNVSYKWLNEYLDLNANKEITPEKLADKMSRTGIEVEDVFKGETGLKKIVVGHTLSVVDHPDSDHLHICQVDIGEEEPTQIVCGAPNIAKDQKIIVALPGARITGNAKIKKGKIRGEVSNGMVCSLSELGFSEKVVPKKYADGIYVLPAEAVAGEEVFPYLAMDDAILELSITPNRADALSMRGVAYEVGAIYNQKPTFKEVVLTEDSSVKAADYIQVEVENSVDVPSYNMRIIKDVKIAESPLWMQTKLMNAGIRPINNVVDITNYILLEYGQPLHAFDYDRLGSKEILVRRGKQGEVLITLDGEERKLSEENIVVTNGEIPVALAGVMGGLDSEIQEDTVTVALESALFESTTIRRTAKEFNLRSEGSARFEKGINTSTILTACDHAAQLMVELAGGTIVSGVVSKNVLKPMDSSLNITLDRINGSLGTAISSEEVVAIFERLGFGVTHSEGLFDVTIPPRRWDISIEADLIEEVARIYGYDNLPSTLPISEATPGMLNENQRLVRHTRRYLEGAGLSQAISYVLTTPTKASQFMMRESEATMLDMPMTEERSTLRMNLLSGLLDDVRYNKARKNQDVALYEIGRVFYKVAGKVLPLEEEHVAGVMTGLEVTSDWQQSGKAVDFFTVKGVLEGLLAMYGFTGSISYQKAETLDGMHPGRTALILLDGEEIGYLGQIHPLRAKEYDLKETYGFEINLQKVMDAPKAPTIYQTIPKYPGMTRDMALLVDETVDNQELTTLIKAKGGKYLQDVQLFDVYNGEKIEAGKKSMAYKLIYLNPEATLVEEEVTLAFEKVTNALVETFHVVVR
ncbi:phenylalanine--tRNA ligase subunit beta [Carnobacterium divergens]|uniref:Phenylalanine--tRNA ligase beta subunit n=1 Tax=Carnobacterium divergens TaxID=2748 RepID=A0AAW8RFV6_CARDV|nr:phenylalanine--tRNA ligase subunit beta [Carnobacterium divergens]MDT1959205.1 phenylalanine--tRNA ligase subunit beta [Carnobacterium divergens]MDT1975093.1 phenylalanine--tRNA ligase subunit beta [Carnobacterium divergens]